MNKMKQTAKSGKVSQKQKETAAALKAFSIIKS